MKKLFLLIMIACIYGICIGEGPQFIPHFVRGGNGYIIYSMYNTGHQNHPEWPEVVCYERYEAGLPLCSKIYTMEHIFKCKLVTSSGMPYRQKGIPFLVKVKSVDTIQSPEIIFPEDYTVNLWNSFTEEGNHRFGFMNVRAGEELKQEPAVVDDDDDNLFAKVIMSDPNGEIMIGVGNGDKDGKMVNGKFVGNREYLWPGSKHGGTYYEDLWPISRVGFIVAPYKKDARTTLPTDDPNSLFEPQDVHFIQRRFPGQDAVYKRIYDYIGGIEFPAAAVWSYFALTSPPPYYPSPSPIGAIEFDSSFFSQSYMGDYMDVDNNILETIEPSQMDYDILSYDPNSLFMVVETSRSIDPNNGDITINYAPLSVGDELNLLYSVNQLNDYSTYRIFYKMEVSLTAPMDLHGTMVLESGIYDPNLCQDPNELFVVNSASIPVIEIYREGNMAWMATIPMILIDDRNISEGTQELDDGVNVFVFYSPEGSQLRLSRTSQMDYNGNNVIDIADLEELSYYWLGSLPDVPFNLVLENSDYNVDLNEFAYLASKWLEQ